MTIQVDAWSFVLSETGQEWLSRIGEVNEHNHLQWAMKLRESFSVEQTHALLEIALLRGRGLTKFSQAKKMYFTRDGLEQASGEEVAHYRSQRFWQAGCQRIADLGCGIGGDALALAEKATVIGIDQTLTRLWMARENMRVYGREGHFWPLQADLMHLAPLKGIDGLFFDPARRDEHGRRLFSVDDYYPPLSLIDQWRIQTPAAAVKISPGVDYTELPPAAEAEFVSLNGEVKECVLWYGPLRTAAARRATLLPDGFTLTSEQPCDGIPLTEPQAFLYEPDGAIIRAHLVEHLAYQLGLSKIDDQIAYLTAAHEVESPAVRAFRLTDWFPFQLKRLRHYLREHQIGQVVIKKRGSPIEPDTLRRQLRLSGNAKQATLFLTHVQGTPAVLIGEEHKKEQ